MRSLFFALVVLVFAGFCAGVYACEQVAVDSEIFFKAVRSTRDVQRGRQNALDGKLIELGLHGRSAGMLAELAAELGFPEDMTPLCRDDQSELLKSLRDCFLERGATPAQVALLRGENPPFSTYIPAKEPAAHGVKPMRGSAAPAPQKTAPRVSDPTSRRPLSGSSARDEQSAAARADQDYRAKLWATRLAQIGFGTSPALGGDDAAAVASAQAAAAATDHHEDFWGVSRVRGTEAPVVTGGMVIINGVLVPLDLYTLADDEQPVPHKGFRDEPLFCAGDLRVVHADGTLACPVEMAIMNLEGQEGVQGHYWRAEARWWDGAAENKRSRATRLVNGFCPFLRCVEGMRQRNGGNLPEATQQAVEYLTALQRGVSCTEDS